MTTWDLLEASLRERPKERAEGGIALLPPANERELRALQRYLGSRAVPLELQTLLAHTSGFESRFGRVDFLGRDMSVETFFDSLPILTDGSGNHWVIDLQSEMDPLGPIFYWCHDPPVAVMQAPTLVAFIEQLLEDPAPERTDWVGFVKNERALQIWRNDPNWIPAADASRFDRLEAGSIRGELAKIISRRRPASV